MRQIFFPGFGWKGEWHSSLSLRTVFHRSPRSTASCRTTLCYGTVRGAAANPSSALQLSLFLRFVQIEPYFVSNLLRVLHTSKVREIILNTASVCADENSETQTKPLACGFSHCVKQRQCCCSHCQCSLYSAALNLFLTDGAEEGPFPGNHPRHLPLHFKPLENPEAHTRRIQDFFLITQHLQLSPQLPPHVLTSASTEMSSDSTGYSWRSDTDFIG